MNVLGETTLIGGPLHGQIRPLPDEAPSQITFAELGELSFAGDSDYKEHIYLRQRGRYVFAATREPLAQLDRRP